MAEQYLSDADLTALSGTIDPTTGLPYFTIGQDPHYVAYMKAWWALARLAARSADLQAFKDGTLTFGVRAGRFDDNAVARNYAGATAQALTNDAVNYVYLTPAAVLTKNTTGWPDAPYIPLATIATGTASGGGVSGQYAISDITDYRGLGLWTPVAQIVPVELNLATSGSPNILTAAETGKTLHNTGATEVNYHTLPAAAAGLEFRFCDVAGAKMLIAAAAGDTIRVETGVTVAGGTISSEAAAAGVHLVAIDATQWVAISKNGSWVIDT